MLLVLSKLKLTRPISATQESNFLTSLLGRIDFLGTTLLIGAISTTLLLIDQGGKLFPWVSCLSVVLLGSSILLLSIFCYAEVYVAKEPIFDLRVLRKENVLASYAVGALQSVAQAGVIFSIPLYFQVTARASTAEAGGHLVPAVLGNTVGALLVGFYTQRFKSYAGLLPFACIASLSTYLLLFFCWNGQTTPLESLFIIPAGLGFGITSTVVFATMVSFLNSEETATVTGGYILLQTFIASVSVTGTNTLLGFEFLKNLRLHIRSQEVSSCVKLESCGCY